MTTERATNRSILEGIASDMAVQKSLMTRTHQDLTALRVEAKEDRAKLGEIERCVSEKKVHIEALRRDVDGLVAKSNRWDVINSGGVLLATVLSALGLRQ